MLSFAQFITEDVQKDKGDPDFTKHGRLGEFKHGKTKILYGVGKDDVDLIHMHTPPKHRGQGHAGKALHHFLQHADKHGKRVNLLASPLDKKTDLHKLVGMYQKHGFTHTGKYGDPTGRTAGHPYMQRKPNPQS